jgi:MFS family permease
MSTPSQEFRFYSIDDCRDRNLTSIQPVLSPAPPLCALVRIKPVLLESSIIHRRSRYPGSIHRPSGKQEKVPLSEDENDRDRAESAPHPDNIFRVRILEPLHYRNFAIFLCGAAVSNIGNWVQTSALSWYINQNTHSSAMVGLSNLFTKIPVMLLVLFTGALADRVDRKRLILLSQACLMVCALALAVTTSFGWPTMWPILTIMFFTGFATALNGPAWSAIIPDLLPMEKVPSAVTLNNLKSRLTRFVGLLISGLILTYWSASAAFYVNAASYLLVIAAIWSIRLEKAPSSRTQSQAPGQLTARVSDGWRYIRRNGWAKSSLTIMMVMSLFGASSATLLPSYTTDVLKRSAGEYSWLWSAGALGAILGVAVLTILTRRYRSYALVKIGCASFGLLLIGVSLSRSFPLSMVLMFGMGASSFMLVMALVSVVQVNSDPQRRGIMLGFYALTQVVGFGVGSLMVGLIADTTGTALAFFISGSVCTLLALGLVAFRSSDPDHAILKNKSRAELVSGLAVQGRDGEESEQGEWP